LRRLLTTGRTTQAFYAERRAAWGRLFDAPETATDPDADYKRNMPQEVVSDLGRPFTRLVVDSYLNSFTSLSDVSRHLGLRADKIAQSARAASAGAMSGARSIYCIDTSSILVWFVDTYPPTIIP